MNSTKSRRVGIVTSLQCSTRVFDRSGLLPFDVVFHLTRLGSHVDADPRALLIRTAHSLLDVPYSLKHGLLKIRLDEGDDEQPVDYSDLVLQPRPPVCEADYFTLESTVDSKQRWINRVVQSRFRVDPRGPIAAKLLPGRRYRLVLAKEKEDFPAEWCKFAEPGRDGQPVSFNEEASPGPCDDLILYRLSKTSQVSFVTLPSIRIPPHIRVELSATSPLEFAINEDLGIKLEITNYSDRVVVVKSAGDQRYLTINTWPLYEGPDERRRITCAGPGISKESILLHRAETGRQLYRYSPPVCRGGGLSVRRPKLIRRSTFTTLEPGVALVKEDSLKSMFPLVPLELGEYRLSLAKLGAVWFWGTVEDMFQGEDTVVEEYPWEPLHTLPVNLGSDDEIVFRVV